MIFVSDLFADTAGTLLEAHIGQTGATWAKNAAFPGGSAIITNANRLRSNLAGSSVYYASGVPGTSVQDAEADLYVASVMATEGVGLILAEDPTAFTYYLAFINNNSPNAYVNLFAVQNGTTVGSVTNVLLGALSVGSTHKLRFIRRSGLIAFLFDGVQKATLTDSHLTSAGSAGIFFGQLQTDSTGYHLANFVASTVSPSTPADSNVFFSPYNWRSDGGGAMQANNVKGSSTYALTANPGAYVKTAVNAAANGLLSLVVDTTPLNGITAGNCPTLRVSIDGLAPTDYLLAYSASPQRLQVATGLSAGNHTVQAWFKSVDLTGTLSMGDRWNSPVSVVKITGIEPDGRGSTLTVPAVANANVLVYGDSNLEGADLIGSNLTNAANDATNSWASLLANAEVGMLGWSGQGFAFSYGFGNVPKIIDTATPTNSTWDKYSAGNSRLIGGAFSPVPSAVITALGQNDNAQSDASVSSAVAALIADQRTAAGSGVPLWFLIPGNGSKRSAILQGITAAADSMTKAIDPGAGFAESLATGGINTNDTVPHLNQRGHALMAAIVASGITGTLAISYVNRKVSVSWGVTGLVGTLGVTVEDASGNVLIVRSTSGIVEKGTTGQYVATIIDWNVLWGAWVIVDDGTGTTAGTESIWLDPLPQVNSSGNVAADVQTVKTQAITATAPFSFDAQTTAQGAIATNLNATVSSRLAASAYVAPNNADISSALADLVTLLGRTDPSSALAAIQGVTDHLGTMINNSDGGAWEFNASALKNGPTSSIGVLTIATVLPLASTFGGVVKSFSAFQNMTCVMSWQVKDGNTGDPVNLKPGGTADTIKFILFVKDSDTLVSDSASVSLSQSDPTGHPGVYDVVTVSFDTTGITPGTYEYVVRDLTNEGAVYGNGPFTVKWAPAS